MKKGLWIGGLLAVAGLAAGGSYAYKQIGYDLTQAEAQAIAYKNAGVTEKDVTFQKVEKEREGLTATYNIEFSTATTEYDYTVNASTGSILERDAEANGFAQSSTTASASSSASASSAAATSASSTASQNTIGQEDAKAQAIADAGLEESAVTQVTVQMDNESGLNVYEVEFHDNTAGIEYDYTIDAATGEVIEKNSEAINQ